MKLSCTAYLCADNDMVMLRFFNASFSRVKSFTVDLQCFTMKKLILYFGFCVLVSACNQGTQVQNKSTGKISTGKNSIRYVCPMHPEIVKNKPGTCEKCGMDLVEKQSN